jgi:murein DD-endopeptidase MepM/ murein hydrolase activator NlpD
MRKMDWKRFGGILIRLKWLIVIFLLFLYIPIFGDEEKPWFTGQFAFPLQEKDCYKVGKRITLTSWFYLKREDLYGHIYGAINIPCKENSTVYSITSGEVIQTGYNKYTGITISIVTPQRLVIKYGHLKDWYVKKGDKVAIEPIGIIGRSGRTTGICLYLEANYENKKVCISTIDESGYCAYFGKYWRCVGDGSLENVQFE